MVWGGGVVEEGEEFAGGDVGETFCCEEDSRGEIGEGMEFTGGEGSEDCLLSDRSGWRRTSFSMMRMYFALIVMDWISWTLGIRMSCCQIGGRRGRYHS